MAKVFITGHTSGIGLATFELLQSEGYDVIGGSRSTGFDISADYIDPNLLECDVFINNAYHYTGQLRMLEHFYAQWKNKEKIIINIGSWGKDNQIGRPIERLNYNVAKKALETYSFWISTNDLVCRSMMYNPGFVDTPLARKGLEGWSEEKIEQVLKQTMDPKECAKTILFMIQNKYKFREITHHA